MNMEKQYYPNQCAQFQIDSSHIMMIVLMKDSNYQQILIDGDYIPGYHQVYNAGLTHDNGHSTCINIFNSKEIHTKRTNRYKISLLVTFIILLNIYKQDIWCIFHIWILVKIGTDHTAENWYGIRWVMLILFVKLNYTEFKCFQTYISKTISVKISCRD